MMKKTSEMTLAEKVGQVIVLGGAVGGLGDARPDACLEYALRLIDEHKIGTFYLGYPRYDNPMEAYKLNVRLQEASEIPLLLAADMETALGYVVNEGVQRQPYPMGMGAARDEDLARECGAIVAREARAVGFNWNLGPVVDVNILKDNPGVGIRSFGDDPELVSRLGAAYIEGCQSEGVVCSAKHFPGHGSKSVDTHDEIGVDDSSRDSMMRINLPPFRSAIRAGVKSVMSNHIVFPAFGDERFPATLSKNVMTDLLRGSTMVLPIVMVSYMIGGVWELLFALVRRCVAHAPRMC